ncbi:PA2779 family protein [Ideonella dechloratans]|uniref:PA2779 family protein n=1 Tax=Ideonella dechloratans TaxID=36863 RepID=A0A643FC05_IDEDE|nr:PA2779 family protein [Ideonella dechloratans]KAB0581557.1 PA2779 family protein [Ideonella dechloratans]UFU09495.1 PA2779 family protein [Ideonella dechloratans]
MSVTARSRSSRWLSLVLAASLSYAGMLQGAQAALIGTDAVAAAQAPASRSGAESRALLNQALDRADVVQALQDRGVDPAEARARVAALSDAQAQWMASQIDQAPAAGSDILGVLVFLFVLLLITDILGLTKVFPFTRSAR